MKKLRLNKEVISKLNNEEMKNLKGGFDDIREEELLGSILLCNTNFEPGGGCHKSKSCRETVILCIPITH